MAFAPSPFFRGGGGGGGRGLSSPFTTGAPPAPSLPPPSPMPSVGAVPPSPAPSSAMYGSRLRPAAPATPTPYALTAAKPVPASTVGAGAAGDTATTHYAGHAVSCVAFLPNGSTGDAPPLVVTGGSTGTLHKGVLRVWFNASAPSVDGSDDDGAPLEDALLPVAHEALVHTPTGAATGLVDHRPAVAIATSTGRAMMYTLSGGDDAGLVQAWQVGSAVPAAGTAVDLHSLSGRVATTSEAAGVRVVDAAAGKPTWDAAADHGCALNAVAFQSQDLVLTGGSYPGGQLALWDVRTTGSAPVLQMRDVTPGLSVFSVAMHAVHDTIAVSGTSAGIVCAWDLRAPGRHLSSSLAHSATVWSVAFNPARPSLVYSAGDDGRVLQWDFNHDRAVKPSTDAANPYQMYMPLPSRAELSATAAYEQLALSDQGVNSVAVHAFEARAVGGQRCVVVAGGDSGDVSVCNLQLPSPLALGA